MVAIPNLVRGLFTAALSSTIHERIEALQSQTGCDISHDVAQMNLAAINNSLKPPTNTTPTFVGLAFGVQNYTCTASNNFTYASLPFRTKLKLMLLICCSNIGAVAELFDVSCLVNSTLFADIQTPLFAAWKAFTGPSIQDFIGFFRDTNASAVLAQHYFVPNPTAGQGLSPKWDFAAAGNPALAGNPNASVVAAGKGSVAAPDAAADINWLDVVRVPGGAGGAAADEVFRTDTAGGQPPASVRTPRLLVTPTRC